MLSFNFVSKGDRFYHVPLLLKYTKGETDLLTISPLVIFEFDIDRKLHVDEWLVKEGKSTIPLYFPVSADQMLNNQACFFASVDLMNLNVKSPGSTIFEKVITDKKPMIEVFSKGKMELILEKSNKSCLRDYLNQNEIGGETADETLNLLISKKEIDEQVYLPALKDILMYFRLILFTIIIAKPNSY